MSTRKTLWNLLFEKKKRVFVYLPTGFGKSVIFKALPLLYAFVEPSREKIYRCFSPRKPGEGPSQPVVVSGQDKRHIAKQRNVRSGIKKGWKWTVFNCLWITGVMVRHDGGKCSQVSQVRPTKIRFGSSLLMKHTLFATGKFCTFCR